MAEVKRTAAAPNKNAFGTPQVNAAEIAHCKTEYSSQSTADVTTEKWDKRRVDGRGMLGWGCQIFATAREVHDHLVASLLQLTLGGGAHLIRP